MGAWRWLRVRFARAVWLQARPQQARGLLCAGAGQTPAEAVQFAPGQTGLSRIAPDPFAREAAELSCQTGQLRSAQGRIVQAWSVPKAGVLPQAYRWWNRLQAMSLPNQCQRQHPQGCGKQNLPGLRLAPGLQGLEPLF